jgi:hypothetical protein
MRSGLGSDLSPPGAGRQHARDDAELDVLVYAESHPLNATREIQGWWSTLPTLHFPAVKKTYFLARRPRHSAWMSPNVDLTLTKYAGRTARLVDLHIEHADFRKID